MKAKKKKKKKKIKESEGGTQTEEVMTRMTQHLCQNLLKAPHASLTVRHCRMPASDWGRTKGAVVYHFVSSLLLSFYPPILYLPQQEAEPPLLRQSGRCCAADLNVTAGRCECGWVFVEHEGCGGSEPNKLCREAVPCLSLLSFFFVFQGTRWFNACFHLLT